MIQFYGTAVGETLPYTWTWNETGFGKFTIKAKAYDKAGNVTTTGEMTVFRIF